jgi:4-amino-4-deoxy-L-arabinose transferase-like glycosyltransferase
MHSIPGKWKIWVIVLSLLTLFVGIDNMERPLANPDEGRYTEISREMAATGDWVTPRLNGLKYFEKPPLQYWASALSLRIFGENEYAARLYTMLCGLLCILAVGYTLRRLVSPQAGWLGMGVLVASPYFLAMGGIVTLDMGLTAWTTLAVCAFLLAHGAARNAAETRRWMLLSWGAMGLAILSKGLIGFVFPAATIFLYCLLQRDWALLKRLEWLRGGALFMAIVLPWHIAVSNTNPEFARFYFIHEHFERFLTKSHRREEPWWYFWPILFGGFLPWAVMLLPSWIEGWRNKFAAADRGFHWQRFAIIWSLFITLFFSISGSKLPAYVLPVFPILALVLAAWLIEQPAARLWKLVAPVALVMLICVPLVWGMPDRTKSEWTRAMYLDARPWITAGLIVLVAGLAGATWQFWRGRKWTGIALVVAASVIFVDCFEDAYERLSPRQSGQAVSELLKPRLTPETRIYSVRYYDQTIPFYLGRTVTLVDYFDEFSMGLKQQPALAIPTLDAFAPAWNQPGPAAAFIHPDAHQALEKLGLPMTVLHRDERRMLIVKPEVMKP